MIGGVSSTTRSKRAEMSSRSRRNLSDDTTSAEFGGIGPHRDAVEVRDDGRLGDLVDRRVAEDDVHQPDVTSASRRCGAGVACGGRSR